MLLHHFTLPPMVTMTDADRACLEDLKMTYHAASPVAPPEPVDSLFCECAN